MFRGRPYLKQSLMRSIICLRPQSAPILILALLTTLPGCEWFSSTQKVVSEEEQPRTVYALGRLEPATGVIDIRATPGDRLKELRKIVENEIAPKDGILGTVSSYDMGKAQLRALLRKRELANQKHAQQMLLAKAQLAQANASKAQTEARQTELALQLGKLESLRVARNLAQEEYRRLEQLGISDPELVTRYQLDKQKNQMDLSSADYEIARDSHASATTAAKLAVLAAEANVSVAKIVEQQAAKNFEKLVVDQEIEVAREALKRSILLAPNVSPTALRKLLEEDRGEASQGEHAEHVNPNPEKNPQYTILKVFLHPGEVVTQGPVLQLGDLRKMVCIAEVYEADVKELSVNQTVIIRSPAFSEPFADGPLDAKTQKRTGGIPGHVVRIGRMIASPGLSNRNPLAPADRNVVEVRIEIEGEPKTAIAHASKHVGLQVTVEFGESEKRKAESGKPDA